MKTAIFEGAGTAIVTPFRDSKIDIPAFKRLIDFQAEGGVSALIVCGTTGEAATLTQKEKETLYDLSAEYTNGRMKVICGIGSNNTQSALEHARMAQAAGADGVLMVTPYYNKTTQAGLVKHFEYVADRVDIPVIVYNVPGRTGIGIEPETYVLLARHPNINGVKEASGNLAAFARSKALCGEELVFWSGNDADTVGMMALGAKGVISVASNIVPDAVALLCALCRSGRYDAAALLNDRYAGLFHTLFIEVNPIPIKAAMEMLGLCSGELRLPLIELNQQHRVILENCIKSLER